jgi:tetratricopeptide (TPR) repeat protein
MSPHAAAPLAADPHALHREAERLLSAKRWPELSSLAAALPRPLSLEALSACDTIAFGLTQEKRFRDAFALYEEAFALSPTYRRASALAYVAYASLFAEARPPKGASPLPREDAKRAFRAYVGRALELRPGSIKDLYRLGIFEAQIESAHDERALCAFAAAVTAFETLGPAEQARRGDLRKAYHRALYAAARSALRRKKPLLARRLVLRCVRSDEHTHDVAPLFALSLAGKVLLVTGELDAAERAFRCAERAKGPRERDFVYLGLARVAKARGDLDAARSFIEKNVRPERRTPPLWRELGAIYLAQGALEPAEKALENALRNDREARHVTLLLLGRVREQKGDLKAAERSYREALELRAKRHHVDDERALEGLARVLDARGREGEARLARDRLAKARPRPERERELGRAASDDDDDLPGLDPHGEVA